MLNAPETEGARIRFLDLILDITGDADVLAHPQYPECYAAIQALKPILQVSWHADISPVSKTGAKPEKPDYGREDWPGWMLHPEHPTSAWVTPGTSTEAQLDLLRRRYPNVEVTLLPRPEDLADYDDSVAIMVPEGYIKDQESSNLVSVRVRAGALGGFVFRPGAALWAKDIGYPPATVAAIKDRESSAWDATRELGAVSPRPEVVNARAPEIYRALQGRDAQEQTENIWVAEGDRMYFFVYGPRDNSEKFRVLNGDAPKWLRSRIAGKVQYKRDRRTRRLVRKGTFPISPNELERLRELGRQYENKYHNR